MKSRLNYSIALLISGMFVLSCGRRGGTDTPTDDPTSGKIHITVDESYQPVMEAEIEMFEELYPHADITVSYTNEVKAFQDLLDDSSRFILVNRELNASEMEYFNGIELTPRVTPFAYDGLAFIVSNDCPVRKLLYSQIGDIFTGKLGTWNQIHPSLQKDSVRVIFDNAGSGNVRMIMERFNIKGNLPSNCYAKNSNTEVIDFVEKNKNALGIISVNWISDDTDTNAIDFLKRIKVLRIGKEGNMDTTAEFYGPYQGYIAADMYPFKRTAYIISREARAGLGTGFASFLAGEKGQLIAYRAGMVPIKARVREVEFSN